MADAKVYHVAGGADERPEHITLGMDQTEVVALRYVDEPR